MKIIGLTAENVLRLNALEIKPEGNTVVIGGRNGQGKTSTLESIVLALGGRQAEAKTPLKKGADKGQIVCDLGDIIVTRTFTEKSSKLIVSTKDGATYSSPQKILDALTGSLTFDPLAWSGMGDREQLELLKDMVGLDLSELNDKRQICYDERAGANREIKSLKVSMDQHSIKMDAPDKEVSVSELMDEMAKAQDHNGDIQEIKDSVEYCNDRIGNGNSVKNVGIDFIKNCNENIKDHEIKIKYLKEQITTEEQSMKDVEKGIKDYELKKLEKEKELKVAKEIDVEPIKQKIKDADSVNEAVRHNKKYKEFTEDLKVKEQEAKTYTDKILKIDQQKMDEMAKAEFPINGLSFDDSGVLFDGVPFSQASSAEKLRVSVAMGIAMNPKLKVLLIRDGSLLDDDNLKMVADMAADADAQVWIERVGEGSECQVIIEDGRIKE